MIIRKLAMTMLPVETNKENKLKQNGPIGPRYITYHSVVFQIR